MKLQFFKLLAFIQVAFRAFLVVANKNGSNDLIPPFSYLANQTFTEDVQNVASLDPIRKCIKNGTIALTFDHELNGEYTPKLLDLLKDRKIKATFYIRSVCNYFDPENEENVRLVQRIKAENHTVGISMTDRNTLKNATEFIEALGMSTIAIYEATGVLPRFVHLPKHSIQEDVLRFIDSLGYTRVDANVNLSLNSHDENKGKFSLEHLVNLSCVNNKDGPLNSVIAIQNDDTEFDVDTLNELIHSIQKHCKFYSFVDMQLCIQPNKDTAGSFLIASKTST
ncbi:chitin deacetylase [Coelomomyces lativittatus]|nr:chitin deacetylase [Coelomomyces lativittatus]KAJ1504371.1 chitin deacetylase [Coelomomyces lativittatus]